MCLILRKKKKSLVNIQQKWNKTKKRRKKMYVNWEKEKKKNLEEKFVSGFQVIFILKNKSQEIGSVNEWEKMEIIYIEN